MYLNIKNDFKRTTMTAIILGFTPAIASVFDRNNIIRNIKILKDCLGDLKDNYTIDTGISTISIDPRDDEYLDWQGKDKRLWDCIHSLNFTCGWNSPLWKKYETEYEIRDLKDYYHDIEIIDHEPPVKYRQDNNSDVESISNNTYSVKARDLLLTIYAIEEKSCAGATFNDVIY